MNPPSAERSAETRTWNTDQLERISQADEVRLAPRRADGTLRSFTTMWVVESQGELYVRSAGGPTRTWYRHARATGTGQIRPGGVKVDVDFAEATANAQGPIDAAYHAKYDRFGPSIVGHVTGPDAHEGTVRLVPANHERNEA